MHSGIARNTKAIGYCHTQLFAGNSDVCLPRRPMFVAWYIGLIMVLHMNNAIRWDTTNIHRMNNFVRLVSRLVQHTCYKKLQLQLYSTINSGDKIMYHHIRTIMNKVKLIEARCMLIIPHGTRQDVYWGGDRNDYYSKKEDQKQYDIIWEKVRPCDLNSLFLSNESFMVNDAIRR